MNPNIRHARPIGLFVALCVTPESAGHAGPRRADRELAHLTPHRPTLFVENVGGNSRHRPGKRARLDRENRQGADDAAGDLGPARIVDDRTAPTADLLEVPAVWIFVPHLAGR